MATVEQHESSKSPSLGFRLQYLSWLRIAQHQHQQNVVTTSVAVNSRAWSDICKDAAVDLAAGTAGAVVSVYAGQPMDTVKVKMQTFPQLYQNMTGCIKHTYLHDGLRGLYAGTVPALVANIAENSVLFAAYGMCQKGVAKVAAAKGPEELSSLGNATAGFFAAFFSSLTLCPTELVKCRLQALNDLNDKARQNRSPIGPWRVTKDIMRHEGIPGFFRGLTSTFAREMPGYFCFFGGYEATRSLFAGKGGSKDDIGHLGTFVSGGTAGVCLWTVMFPTDVIKSRIQVIGSKVPMWRCATNIYRREGILAFYNGLGPTVLRTFPATGILLVTYECVKRALTDDHR